MTILHISDTHGQHGKLINVPKADVIVHSGDFTFGGSEKEAIDFMQWFCDLPYKHKVFVAGNHDMCMYGADKTCIFFGHDHNVYGSEEHFGTVSPTLLWLTHNTL